MKKTNKLLLFALPFWLSSCQKESLLPIDHSVIFEENQQRREWTEPTVKNVTIHFIKGFHFTAASIFAGTHCNHISVNVRFDSTIIYKTKNPDNQADLNKLFGFKSGIDGRFNSLLIGFSYDPETGHIRVSPYAQQNPDYFWCFAQAHSPSFEIGDTIHIELTNYEDRFYVIIGGFQYEIFKADYGIKNYKQALTVMPHWGGQEAAQRNTSVYL